MPSTATWKLRRLAPRAKRVMARRRSDSPAFIALEATLIPAADAFMNAYDGIRPAEVAKSKEMKEGKDAVKALLSSMQMWLPFAMRDIPGFDRSAYLSSTVPDDLSEDADALIDAFKDAVQAGAEIPYAHNAMSDLATKLQAADKEWAEAEAANANHENSLATTRTTSHTFDQELQLLRKLLRHAGLRKTSDYQKLRVRAAASPDEDDDPNAPLPSKPITAAADDAQPPASSK